MNYEKELNAALEAAILAKKISLKYYHDGFHVEIKDDKSPVTEADKECDLAIRKYLHERFPSYAFLTEESVDNLERLNNDYVWIVDPIDGTEDFVRKDGEFTVNIALAYKHEPVLGVIEIPTKNEIYYATKNSGAFKIDSNGISSPIHVNDKLTDLTVVRSRYHSDPNEDLIFEKYSNRIKNVLRVGSSIKACMIAEGKAEISYRLKNGTKEWDTCAFQAIVEEAGGYVLKFDGTPLKYNRKDVYNRDGYIIINRKENFIF